MQKWQSDILDAMAKKTYETHIISVPRHSGKSAYNRMVQDILARPVDDITLSESKIHGKRIYAARPQGGVWFEMEEWCTERFGAPGSVWDLNIHRWYMNDRTFFFSNEADRTMFVLKWR